MPKLNLTKMLTYPLDNAALIYQALITRRQPHFFRLAVYLKTEVEVAVLQRALEAILPRFPIMRTHLKSGIFWSYLTENRTPPTLHKDSHPAFFYNLHKRGAYPFRVSVYQQRISLETTHLVTDGYGARTFLQALVVEYFSQLGATCTDTAGIIRPSTPFDMEEISDAYRKIGKIDLPNPPNPVGRAFNESGKAQTIPFFKTTRYKIPLTELKIVAKKYNITITEYLMSLYIASYQDRMFLLPPNRRNRRPIRIKTPVNLRAFFPSKSLRNFIGFVMNEIDPRVGIFSFSEIMNEVHHTMRKSLIDKHFHPFIGRNIRSEATPILAIIPLIIKKIGLNSLYIKAMQQETSVLSNLGTFTLPVEIEDLVESAEFVPAPKLINKRDCAIITYQDTVSVVMSRICVNAQVERFFFDRLCIEGLIPVIEEFKGYN